MKLAREETDIILILSLVSVILIGAKSSYKIIPRRDIKEKAIFRKTIPEPEEARLLKVDINRASAEELSSLPKIGPVLAERIVLFREKKGIKEIEELKEVKGIGEKTIEYLRPYITTDRF